METYEKDQLASDGLADGDGQLPARADFTASTADVNGNPCANIAAIRRSHIFPGANTIVWKIRTACRIA